MQEIQPSVAPQDIVCMEVAAPPNAIVVFGASGDLSRRKLLASIFQIFTQDLLDERFYLLGCGRKKFSDESFREVSQQAIRENISHVSIKDLNAFTEKLYYIDGDYSDAAFYKRIKARLAELDKKHKVQDNLLFYLAVPPFLYPTIVEHLGSAGLACTEKLATKKQIKLIV